MLLTVRDAARMLNVSKGCVYTLVSSGRLPHHRVGVRRGRIRIRQEDLEAYLAGRRVDVEERPQPERPAVRRLRHLRN